MDKKNFTYKLRLARHTKEYTQSQVAQYINTHQSTLARYELGIREPNLEHLIKLAKLYDISIDWLLDL